jgi:hypothetical protein
MNSLLLAHDFLMDLPLPLVVQLTFSCQELSLKYGRILPRPLFSYALLSWILGSCFISLIDWTNTSIESQTGGTDPTLLSSSDCCTRLVQ